MYFNAYDGTTAELWKSDGTEEGTVPVPVADLGPFGPFQLTRAGSSLFFTSEGSVGQDITELWMSDGSTEGTSMVKEIPKNPDTFGILNLAPVGSRLFFSSSDPAGGADLWVSDGSLEGTIKLKRFAGASSDSVSQPVPLGPEVYFSADDGTHGVELWKSNGTKGGTSRVADLNPSGDGTVAPGLGVAAMTAWHSKIFFAGNDGSHGSELWKTDGTSTHRVKDINPGAASSSPDGLTPFGKLLLFSANDGTHGNEPWRTNGTGGGTVLLKDIAPNGNSRVHSIVSLGRLALFLTGTSGTLRRTNGTTAGTVLVRSSDDGGPVSIGTSLARVTGIGVLFAAHGGPGNGLWKSNGWRNGTVPVKDFTPGPLGTGPQQITSFGASSAIFSVDDGAHGQEPWITNGTEPGTMLVRDINTP
jgi:ELWxxDGT repeat protein